MITIWYNLTKKYEVTIIWYEDLIFTTKDLEIFGFDFDNLHAPYHINSQNNISLGSTKKVTKLSDYEMFDEMLKSKNIQIAKLLKATNLPIDKNNQNLLRDIC